MITVIPEKKQKYNQVYDTMNNTTDLEKYHKQPCQMKNSHWNKKVRLMKN